MDGRGAMNASFEDFTTLFRALAGIAPRLVILGIFCPVSQPAGVMCSEFNLLK